MVELPGRAGPGAAALLLRWPALRAPPALPIGDAMHCHVYASLRKPDSYLWLAQHDAFEVVPESLLLMLGDLRFVMEVQLDAARKLPVEDVVQVMNHLRDQGWHLQVPPQETLAAANHPAYTHSRTDDRSE